MDFRLTGQQKECINLSSFNYLGLVEISERENDEINHAIDDYGVAASLGARNSTSCYLFYQTAPVSEG